jgi:hypothetical protein
LFVDASGRVGIGQFAISSPLDDLHISSAEPGFILEETDAGIDEKRWRIRAEGSILRFEGVNDAFNATTPWLNVTRSTGSRSVDNIAFTTGGITERMRLDSTGRLGLGTSSPSTLLHVSGTSTSAIVRIASTGAGAASFNGSGAGLELICGNANTTDKYTPSIKFGSTDSEFTTTNPKFGAAIIAETAQSYVSDTNGGMNLGFWTSPANPGTGNGLVQRMNITQAGNVGIGTTVADRLLHIQAAGTEVNAEFRIQNTDGAGRQITFTGAGSTTQTIRSTGASDNSLVILQGALERARIDNNGRLLVGTSTSAGNGSNIQAVGTAPIQIHRGVASSAGCFLVISKSRNTTYGANTIVVNNDIIGAVRFNADDGTDYLTPAAEISAEVDGTPGTDDMPGRLVLSTTLDGASTPTEALRITNDRVVAYNQAAPAAVNATATLTVANLKTGIITSTSAAATDMTLPTGTDTQAGFSGTYDNMTFEWSVINTGPSLVQVMAATAHTIVGSGSVATGTSGRFASRRTAANTFVSYRLS